MGDATAEHEGLMKEGHVLIRMFGTAFYGKQALGKSGGDWGHA